MLMVCRQRSRCANCLWIALASIQSLACSSYQQCCLASRQSFQQVEWLLMYEPHFVHVTLVSILHDIQWSNSGKIDCITAFLLLSHVFLWYSLWWWYIIWYSSTCPFGGRAATCTRFQRMRSTILEDGDWGYISRNYWGDPLQWCGKSLPPTRPVGVLRINSAICKELLAARAAEGGCEYGWR